MKNNDLFTMRGNWMNENFDARNKKLPVSFTYGGAPFPFPQTACGGGIENGKIDIRAEDPTTGLLIRCAGRVYGDYPAVEWTVYLKNESNADTPLLQDINAVDSRFTSQSGRPFTLFTNCGDVCTASSYGPIEKTIGYGDSQYFAPEGGRPTSGALPFFNIGWDGCGLLLGMGWPGQWRAGFHSGIRGELRVTGGQEIAHMVLRPGEEIRTPLVVLMFCGGDRAASQNMWRQWMLEHNMPKTRGERIAPFSSVCCGIGLTEQFEKEKIDFMAEHGVDIDYFWTDAGWYASNTNWTEVGTWRSDPERYPGTYRAVSGHAHKNGMKTVLWFENERVSPGSEMSKHKNWLLALPEDKKSFRSDRLYGGYFFKDGQFSVMESYRNQLVGGDCLFNLGDDGAREYLTALVSGLIEEYGIDCYRTDFNIAPLEFWISADEADGADRYGITENKYVTGFLKFWDGLQARFPDVVFDTCSSGGRRNDLETLRRALPLLRSDFQANPVCADGNQGHTYGLSFWVPFYGSGCGSGDSYLYRSHLCPFMGIGQDGDITKWQKAIGDWKAVNTHFFGDYYPLTEYSLSREKWIAWQFHTPGSQSGVIQVFKRDRCAEDTATLKLHGLEAGAEYEIRDLDGPDASCCKGDRLMDGGYAVSLPGAPRSAIIKYAVKM